MLPALAQENKNLQLKLGEAVSVYSEKAYRKDGGKIFQAIGNVVILSGKETLYGEKASFDISKGSVELEGNVRFISQDITIYGSRIKFNSINGELEMQNARIVTSDFNIVAESLVKQGPELYYAKQAEFTTCKDCAESWSIFGEEIYIELNQYVKVYHALLKAKGIQILYIPFVALPIKTARESGLLFPRLLSRVNEGVSYQQPIYWAISEDKDATFVPSFWGKRGAGLDWEYRQAFSENNWLEYNHRFLEDKIYEPGKTNQDLTGKSFLRNFYEVEAHTQWSNSVTQHIVGTGMRDLDMFIDFPNYMDQYLNESSVGASGFVEKRFMNLNFGVEAEYKRNLLVNDATLFDKDYVQTLPSVYLNIMPQNIYHSDTLFLQNISLGLNSDYTVFKQMRRGEDLYLRNASRVNAMPYLHWHFLNYGPISLSTRYTQSVQHYDFLNEDEEYFFKSAGFMKTEFSFSMDRIFGLAYEEQIDVEEINPNTLKDVLPKKELNKKEGSKDLIGKIPDFEESLTEDTVTVVQNSYRHSQDFKFIHHYIANSEERGNNRFFEQIQTPEGWFDYDDAILEDQADLGSNATRTIIPRKNTIEFQWNNLLIKKTPKKFNTFLDQRYLRDNFEYSRIGYFNLSQGFLLDTKDDEASFNDKLTRLFVQAGYNAPKWNLNFKEYYFHQSADQITELGFQKRFGIFNALAAYSANSLPGSNLRTLKLGGQVRPADVIGLSAVGEFDLDAEQNIRTIYQADFMPSNNCWILNLNYQDSVVGKRYAFNIVFNLGNEEFKDYRRNFFSFNRLN